MHATLLLQQRAVPGCAVACRKRQPSRRLTVAVRAHGPDEDDVLPIWTGRMPEAPDPSQLKRTAPLGGKTLGEELEIMQKAFEKEEQATWEDMHKHLYSSNWQGDVYVGSKWNMLTLLMGFMFFTPIFGLLFAYLSYGTLWTGHYYGI